MRELFAGGLCAAWLGGLAGYAAEQLAGDAPSGRWFAIFAAIAIPPFALYSVADRGKVASYMLRSLMVWKWGNVERRNKEPGE